MSEQLIPTKIETGRYAKEPTRTSRAKAAFSNQADMGHPYPSATAGTKLIFARPAAATRATLVNAQGASGDA
jgi:hypothetical protein